MKGQKKMPYTPTSWDDIGEDLRRLFREIICSDDGNTSKILREAITLIGNDAMNRDTFYDNCRAKHIVGGGRLIKNCWDFVAYQHDMSKRRKSSLQDDGFQIGSPWHGDVIQAPILFLSINPGLTYHCYFPRWYPSNDGTTDRFDLDGCNITEEGIYNFLTTRLHDDNTFGYASHIDSAKGGYPNAVIRGGTFKREGVPYWKRMCEATRQLLNIPAVGIDFGKLMRSVLSAEVIFWGSKNQDGGWGQKTLNYYWDKFVVPLLEKCGAEILILVGHSALTTFNSSFNRNDDEKNPQLKSGGVYSDLYMGKFKVAAVNHFSYSWHKDGNLPQNYSGVCGSLRADPQAQPAIEKALSLYHM
ncbi:MAG: hypothetical protein IJP89_00275 [Synergistaceae bacterium]|nr:hypothetical protein [Synergistaceae bacterium]MBR0256161.1 hypothetical protein [Synergistaceae bacterium]